MRAGIYKFFQFEGKKAMDLAARDNKTIIACDTHQGDNQKWEFSPFGAGHSIKSVRSGTYLTCGTVQMNAEVIATPYPVSWSVEKVQRDKEEPTVRILWPNSPLAMTLSSLEVSKPLLKLASVGQAGQEWTALRIDEPTPAPSSIGSGAAPQPCEACGSQHTCILPKKSPAVRIDGPGQHPTIEIHCLDIVPENGTLIFTSATSNTATSSTVTTVTRIERYPAPSQ